MKRTLELKKFLKGKYTLLLIIFIVNFGLSPFFQGPIANIVLSIVFLYALFLIVRTFSLKLKLLRLYSSVAILAFILGIIGKLSWDKSWIFTYEVLIQFVYAVYLGLALYWILRDIFLTHKVTADIVRGGICAYLLIGYFWGLLYGMTASVDPNAFSEPLIVEEESFSRIIYFSFTTLTTLGYGDILPLTPLARMLTNLEAIIGQLFPAIYIAILVGDYMSQRSKKL